MVNLTYQKVCRLAKLSDEIAAGIPSLAPTPLPDGSSQSMYLVAGNANGTIVTVPDASFQAQVDPIVAAHDPSTPDAQETAAAQRAANLATLQSRAQSALTNNTTYLGLASPSNAQVAAQVKALTRQMDGVVRLSLNLLDSIADS